MQPPSGLSRALATATPQSTTRRRILVVDDNVDAAQSLELLLGHLGHEVQIAHEGGSAIETARVFQPDVIFLDIALPGMNGYEVARTLRSIGWSKRARIFALTGFNDEAHRSPESDFDGYLAKPVDFESIVRTLLE